MTSTHRIIQDRKAKKAAALAAFAGEKTQPRKWGQDAAFAESKTQSDIREAAFTNRSRRDRDRKAKKAAAKAAFAEAKKQREMQTMRTPPGKEHHLTTAVQNAIRAGERNRLKCESHGGRWTRSGCVMPGKPPQPTGGSWFSDAKRCERFGGSWSIYGRGKGQRGTGHCSLPQTTQPVPPPDIAPTPSGWHLQPPPQDLDDALKEFGRTSNNRPYQPQDPEDTHVQDREEASEHPGVEVDQEETEKRDAVIVDDSTTPGPETMPIQEKKGVNPLLLIGAAAGALLLATR